MPSFTTLTVLFGFYAIFCCVQLLGGEDTMAMTMTRDASQSHSGGLAGLAGAALVPAVLATLVLTPLLAFAHVVRAMAAGNGNNGDAGARLVTALAWVTFLAATVALLAGAVVQLGADGHLDRGRDDVARLNVK